MIVCRVYLHGLKSLFQFKRQINYVLPHNWHTTPGQIYDLCALTFEQTIADLHINDVGTAGGSTIDTFSHKICDL